MASPIHEWGECRFEPAEYRLTRGGQPVTLPGKTLDLLALLVARAPSLVPKADILQQVWPDSIVEEGNVAFHVAALRKALDREGEPTCIETVRGRGYRFAAPVTTPAVTGTQAAGEPIARASSVRRARVRWAAAVAIMVVAVAGLAFGRSLTKPDRVIVLPFEMIGDDFQRLDLSLVGFMTNAIESRGIHVVAREGGPDGETARAAGARLGAWALVTGTLQPAGTRWRVTVRLVRVSDGLTMWNWEFLSRSSLNRQETQGFISGSLAEGLSQYLNAPTN